MQSVGTNLVLVKILEPCLASKLDWNSIEKRYKMSTFDKLWEITKVQLIFFLLHTTSYNFIYFSSRGKNYLFFNEND